MASELEEAAEIAKDQIQEHLSTNHKERPKWVSRVGISTMIMALLIAIGALLAGYTADELMIERTEAIMELTEIQTNRLDIETLKSKHDILRALDQSIEPGELKTIAIFEDESKSLEKALEEESTKFKHTLREHYNYAVGITLLSIALTLAGMCIIIENKKMWYISLGISVIGLCFLTVGCYHFFI